MRGIVGEFFIAMQDGHYNKRLSEIIADSERISKARSNGGLRSAEKRRDAVRSASRLKKVAKEHVFNTSSTRLQDVSVSPSPSPSIPEEKLPSGAKRKPQEQSRGSRLPAQWIPEAAFGPYQASELAKFRDYWVAKPGQGGVKLDWDATWRNWMRRASEQRGGSAYNGVDDGLRGAI